MLKHDETVAGMAAIFKERGQSGTLREGKTGKEHQVSLIEEEDTSMDVKNMSGEVVGRRRILKWSMSAAGAMPRHGDFIVGDDGEFRLNGVWTREAEGKPFLHYLTSDSIEYEEGREPPGFRKDAA